LNKLT